MESGYNHDRQCGGVVGRKNGYRKTEEQMKEQYVEELKLLKKGISLKNITRITGTSKNTLLKQIVEKNKMNEEELRRALEEIRREREKGENKWQNI
jgi:polyhydroxyalkanoate synthesis regulator phasin